MSRYPNSWLRRALAGAAMLLGTAAAQAQAPSCDRLPRFEPVERFVADDAHGRAIEVIASPGMENREKRALALLPALQASIERVRRQRGAESGLATIVYADWAKLARIADQTRFGESAATMLRLAFEHLSGAAATTAEGDYLVDLARTEARSPAERVAAVRRHRAASGSLPRQVSALEEFFEAAEAAGDRMLLARAMRELAAGLGDRARYAAEGAFLRAVAAGASDPTAVAAARALLPEAKQRLERTRSIVESGAMPFFDDRCLADDNVVEAITTILRTVATHAELEAAYEVEALEAVTFGELQTDFAGASYAFFDILTLRAIDDAKYRDLVRYFGRINSEPERRSTEIDMAITGADVFEAMGFPDLAREFLRDAKAWSADLGDPRIRFDTLLRSLRFEWDTGGSGRLDGDIAEARGILASGAKIDPIARIHFAVFEAGFHDSRLEDDAATEALARAVDIALGEVADTFDGRNVTQEFSGGISALVVDHLRGRFCAGCEAAIAPSVAKYWRAAVRHDVQSIASGMSDSNVSRDMTAQLAVSSGPVADPLRSEVEAELDRLAAFVSSGLKRNSPSAKIVAAASARGRRDLLVAASLFPGSMDLVSSDDRWNIVIPILAERDLKKKRSALRPIVAQLAEEQSSFGGDTGVFDELDSCARALADLGLPLSARAFFEEIVRLAEPGHGIEFWTEPDEAARIQLARVLAPVYARMGRYALDDRDWKRADARLDVAAGLMARRLEQEWRVGSDQAGLLLRAFQPALRLVAQLRFFLAMEKDARAALPGIVGKAFSDLQLAMLGDTALAMQGAIRNGITRDAELREAIDRRDRAEGRLAQIEATERLAPSRLPWVVEARRAELGAVVQAASATVARKLTVPEGFAGLAPVSVGEAASALGDGEALAVLHVGSSNLYGLVLRPGREPALFVSKISAADLTGRIAQLRREAASFGAVDMGNAAALYDLLLRPVEQELDGVDSLVAVADGPLPGLPWAMLSTEALTGKLAGSRGTAVRGAKPVGDVAGAGGADWASQPFLIRRYPVSLSPNIRSLVAQRGALGRSAGARPFLGVGDPLLGGDASAGIDVASLYVRGAVDAAALAALAPLPETAAELRALAGSQGAGEDDLLLASRATETELAARPLSDYRVLAFATHGILAGEVGGTAEPGLVLSPERSPLPGRDGYLALSEIMALKLDADLVILSACNTGGADGRPRAEWMSGLARGFIAAGARRLLVTLWSIPSAPTVRLTTGMSAAYSREPSRGWPRALQSSILSMIDAPASPREAHPASWASFTVLGAG